MSPILEQLGIDRMSADERISLAYEILDSVIADRPPPLSDAQITELRRRVAMHEANPNDVVPWEEVEAQALARLKP